MPAPPGAAHQKARAPTGHPARAPARDEGITLTSTAKGGRLAGGALSEEALASSPDVLRAPRGRRGLTVGLQQYFAPPEAAALIAAVIGPSGAALDPTAGRGDLLAPWPADLRHGVEIDPDQVGAYRAIVGDLQLVQPLLLAARVAFDVVLLNPPFGLTWREGGRAVGSTLLALRHGLALLAPGGEGALICGRDRFAREIRGAPEGRGAYALLEVPDLFAGVALPCLIAFLADPGRRTAGSPETFSAQRADLGDPALAARIRAARARLAPGLRPELLRRREPHAEAWAAIAAEHDRRRGLRRRRSPHDAALAGGRVAVRPSPFARLALAARGELAAVLHLDQKPVSYFALNGRDWRRLERASAEGALLVDPELAGAVARARAGAERALVPLYPLPPQQRLGWLDRDGDGAETILCARADPDRGFAAGARYRVRADSRIHREDGERVETGRDGEPRLRRYQRERRLLRLRVGEHELDESPVSLAYLAEHFEIPDPGDVSTRMPAEVADARALLERIAAENHFRLRGFQLDDLSRLVVKGSGLISWEVGLGKTVGAMTLAAALARRGARDLALFVAPQDLIRGQWPDEAARFFGRRLELIETPADARAAARRIRAGASGWWGTYYEALSVVGRREERRSEIHLAHPREYYRLPAATRALTIKHPGVREAEGSDDPDEKTGLLSIEQFCPGCLADRALAGPWEGGAWDGTVCRRCGYAHRALLTKAAAHPLGRVFRDGVICVDEISQAAGESLRSRAIRALRARHRFGLSGTPIKNYVNDLYHPLQWILGGGGERFPYPLSGGGKAKFERDFCVIESLYGARAKDSHRIVRRRVLPEATNLSMLWRILCSGTIRRRKEDTGEPLAERTLHVVRVPPGAAQLAQHGAWLARFADFFAERHPGHALVEAGLVDRFAAALGLLWKLEYAATLPAADPDAGWTGVAVRNWTPKLLRALEIALSEVRRGRKVVIFSDLVETGVWLAARLNERGASAIHITEERGGRTATTSPRRRAGAIERFTRGDAQVLCAGIQAIRQGWNFDMAQSAIVVGLPWSYEQLEQALGRVHRLTSARPVDVHCLLTDFPGALDARKWDLVADKGASSDLALDGRLVSGRAEEVNWQRVLEEMRAAGVRPDGSEVPEAEVRAAWERAEGALAPLGAPERPSGQGRLIRLPERAAVVVEWEALLAEEPSGQLALAL